MTKRPRLLDLFCGAGGAGYGFDLAGFDVLGVDVVDQPNYPLAFVRADAMTYPLDGFDAIHASPPCQHYSSATRDPSRHPDLYAATRDRLVASGVPWSIENVIGSPYRSGIVLCGSMFGMRIYRHRNFETSFLLMQPEHDHRRLDGRRPYTITGHLSARDQDYRHSLKPSRELAVELMGMPWATWSECVLAIPPAYTEWIGREMLDVVRAAA